jgi:hypothetical protein
MLILFFFSMLQNPTTMTVQTTTIDLSQISTSANITLSTNNTITHSTTMMISPVFGDIGFLYGVGGQLVGQVPFAFGLSYDGYTGIEIEGSSVGNTTKVERAASVIPGIDDPAFRSPFRRYDGREIPGSVKPMDKPLKPIEIMGIVVGAIAGLMVIISIVSKLRDRRKSDQLNNDQEAAGAETIGELHELDAIPQYQDGDEDETGLPGYGHRYVGGTQGAAPLTTRGPIPSPAPTGS